jgi:hypothetical protein
MKTGLKNKTVVWQPTYSLGVPASGEWMMDQFKEGTEVVFDPISKSVILKRGNKVEMLPGPYRNYQEAKRAAAAHIRKLTGEHESEVY